MFFQKHLVSLQNNYGLASQWMRQRFSTLVNRVVDPEIVLPPEDIIAHQVTTYSYYPPEARPLVIGDYTLEHVFENEDKACVYVNHVLKRAIIGYKGSNFVHLADVMSDIGIVLGVSGIDSRIEDSLKVYDAVRLKYPEYAKAVCGHSLGGTICYIVAKHRDPERCTVFNPGSSLNSLFVQMLTDTVQKVAWTQHVYTYKIIGDPVSAFSFVGHTKVFRVPSADPHALHELKNFMQPGVVYQDDTIS